MDEESIGRICASAFTEDDITQAKSLLFDSLPTSRRNITRKGGKKTARHIDDIICLLKETDPELIPTFVARDLHKLLHKVPPVIFDHVDVTRLFKDLLRMQNEMNQIKEKYATVQQVNCIRSELEVLIAAAVTNNQYVNQINTKRGGSPFEKSNSYNTVLSMPNSPLLRKSNQR